MPNININITNPLFNNAHSIPNTDTLLKWCDNHCYWVKPCPGSVQELDDLLISFYKLGQTKIGQKLLEDARKTCERLAKNKLSYGVIQKGIGPADMLEIYTNGVENNSGVYSGSANNIHVDPKDPLILAHELLHYVQQNSEKFVYAISTPEHFCVLQKRMETETCLQDVKLAHELNLPYMSNITTLYEAFIKRASQTTSSKEKQERIATTEFERFLWKPNYKLDKDLGLTEQFLENLENMKATWTKYYHKQTIDNFSYALKHKSYRNTIETEKKCLAEIGERMGSDLSYEELLEPYKKGYFQYENSNNYILGSNVICLDYTKKSAFCTFKIVFAYQTFGQDYTEQLIARGIKFDTMDLNGQGLLHYAAQKGDAKFIAKLVSMGLDVNQPDKNNIRPINLAIVSGIPQAVQCLTDNGAQIDVKDNHGRHPISWLYAPESKGQDKEKIEIATILLQKGADIDSQDDSGLTILGNAVEHRNVEFAKFLVAHKANIHNNSNPQHLSPINRAKRKNYPELIAILNGQTPTNQTSLHNNLKKACQEQKQNILIAKPLPNITIRLNIQKNKSESR